MSTEYNPDGLSEKRETRIASAMSDSISAEAKTFSDHISNGSKIFPEWINRIIPYGIQIDGAGSLCIRCRDENMQKILSTGHDSARTTFLGFRTENHCTFCKLLQGCAKAWSIIDLSQEPELPQNSIKSSYFEYLRGTSDTENITVTGLLICKQSLDLQDLSSVYPYQINFQNLTRKLAYCSKNHGHLCNPEERTVVPGMQLINCETRKLEHGIEGKRYAALSYVWSSSYPPPSSDLPRSFCSERIPPQLERTIEDAMTVTKTMGFEYLWVDRYCINQADPQKHQQIRQMDLIYHNAELTIVAAAGEGPDYGLPGVSTRPRTKTTGYRIGDLLFLEYSIADNVFSSQKQLIQCSKWNSRAWTYQEGVLSRRCLVFTDKEVSFCCSSLDVNEGSEALGHICHDSEKEKKWRESCLGPIVACGVRSRAKEIFPCLTKYSGRHMSYESDALDAFSGMLRAFGKLKPPIYHLWGQLILPPIRNGEFQSSPAKGKRYQGPRADGLLRAMDWKLIKPCNRRFRFPSWSWLGWSCTSGESFSWDVHDNWEDGAPVPVSVELNDGSILSWSQFERQKFLKDNPEMLSTFLWLDTWTIQHTLRYLCLDNDPEYQPQPYASLLDKSGNERLSQVDVENETAEGLRNIDDSQKNTFTSILLGSPDWKDLTAIIVKEDGGFCERIARFSLREDDLQPANGRKGDGWSLKNVSMERRLVRLG